MSQPAPTRHPIRRLLVAVTVGVVVALASYLIAFCFLRTPYAWYQTAWSAKNELRYLATAVENHHEQIGRYPAALTDIDGIKDAFKHDGGRLIDYWGNPIQYSATETGFTLFSFGRDGQPGGDGDDADVYHDRPLELPSLQRFTFDLPTQPLRWVSVLTGIGSAVIVFQTRCVGRALAFQAVATTIGALLIAFVLSVLHIPSGH